MPSAVSDARHPLQRPDWTALAVSSEAQEILWKLNVSLDHAKGGEIAQRLGAALRYMQPSVAVRHYAAERCDPRRGAGLLSTLGEAWQGTKPTAKAAETASGAWGPAGGANPTSGRKPGVLIAALIYLATPAQLCAE